jgi:hypothetical protein
VDNTSRENSATYKLKAVVIEGIINAYKAISEIQIEKGWTKAGKYVYEDNDKPQDGSGYYLAWDTDTQNDAKTRYAAGTLFDQGMSGGISDIGGNIRFIPKAGRKKKQTTEEGTDLDPEDMEESIEETEASSQQFSEDRSSECPDEFIDEDTAEDTMIDPIPD